MVEVSTNLIVHARFQSKIAVGAFRILASDIDNQPLLVLFGRYQIHPILDLLLDFVLICIIILLRERVRHGYSSNWVVALFFYIAIDKVEIQVRCMRDQQRLRYLLKVEALQIDFERRNKSLSTLT